MIQSQYGGDNNIIVEGHGRLAAAKELGYKELDCIRLDHLTDEERRAYTLTHNKLTMNTDFDIDILDEEIKNILNTINTHVQHVLNCVIFYIINNTFPNTIAIHNV